ncbi:putative membrane protein [Burkholderia sp. MSHR3999]|uniref:hypothetical protein n=1 Tax=Burkholderia sp. MSHR3999 TaxID=1542965 RepID=UPI0005ACBB04|nr:hypothetical protein [Burkholderia sp. MSHR3999]KIP17253.1 putative membrane protein [Burkholderia sp. MSHR3999]
MSHILAVSFKTTVLGIVTYFSLMLLGFHDRVALLLALVPVVLMMLSVYTGIVVRGVALIFLTACLVFMLSDRGFDWNGIAAPARKILLDAKSRLQSATR